MDNQDPQQLAKVEVKKVSKLKVTALVVGLIIGALGLQRGIWEYRIRTPRFEVGTCFRDVATFSNGVKAPIGFSIVGVEGKGLKKVYNIEGLIMMPINEVFSLPMPVVLKAGVHKFQKAIVETGHPVAVDCNTGEPLGIKK